jgi:hypothetical protein
MERASTRAGSSCNFVPVPMPAACVLETQDTFDSYRTCNALRFQVSHYLRFDTYKLLCLMGSYNTVLPNYRRLRYDTHPRLSSFAS